MSYRSTDTELEALARMTHTPEWAQVAKVLEREHAAYVEQLMASVDVHQLHRAQGAARALKELLELAATSAKVVLEKRDRHTKKPTSTPLAGAWT